MKSVILILSMALLIFGGVSVAEADAVDFKIGDAIPITYDSTELTIVSETYTFPGITQLNVGDSFKFDYGTINSIKVLISKDTYSITAYLSFIMPEEIVVGNPGTVTTIEVTGMCGKTSDKFWIDFDPVDEVFFDTNGSFTVELSDIYAYPVTGDACGSYGGCYFTKEGENTITATVTLNKSPTAVPEPSTFILFGTVLIGALGVKRIKR